MKYEGGSLQFDQHNRLKTTITETGVLLDQGENHFSIPIKSITEVSYGNDVHRRVGAAIGLAMVSFGIGALMLLAKTKKHYVGMTWLDAATAASQKAKAVSCSKSARATTEDFYQRLKARPG